MQNSCRYTAWNLYKEIYKNFVTFMSWFLPVRLSSTFSFSSLPGSACEVRKAVGGSPCCELEAAQLMCQPGEASPPLTALGLVAGRGAHTRCLPSVAFCAERAHVCVRGAAGVGPPCRSVGILQAGAVQSPSPGRRRGKCGMC